MTSLCCGAVFDSRKVHVKFSPVAQLIVQWTGAMTSLWALHLSAVHMHWMEAKGIGFTVCRHKITDQDSIIKSATVWAFYVDVLQWETTDDGLTINTARLTGGKTHTHWFRPERQASHKSARGECVRQFNLLRPDRTQSKSANIKVMFYLLHLTYSRCMDEIFIHRYRFAVNATRLQRIFMVAVMGKWKKLAQKLIPEVQ